jgi:hypothetical protein
MAAGVTARDRPLTVAEYHRLVDAGVVDHPELLEGLIVMGRYRLVLSPEQARDARRLGVTAYSAVDAVLDDDEARAEVAVRLARRRAETPDTKTIARQRVEEVQIHIEAMRRSGDRVVVALRNAARALRRRD